MVLFYALCYGNDIYTRSVDMHDEHIITGNLNLVDNKII